MKYTLPIIWSFITYLLHQGKTVLLFCGTLLLFWIGGYDFHRSLSTVGIFIIALIIGFFPRMSTDLQTLTIIELAALSLIYSANYISP